MFVFFSVQRNFFRANANKSIPLRKKSFSNAKLNDVTSESAKIPEKKPTWAWWLFRRTLRVVQIGTISFGIYQAGYTNGLIDYAQSPVKMEKQLMKNIVNSEKADGYHPSNSQIHQRVEGIATRIITAAKFYCDDKIKSSQKALESAVQKDDKAALKVAEGEIETWTKAREKIRGSWHCIVTKDTGTVNAFVTALCPRRIFIHEGLNGSFHLFIAFTQQSCLATHVI